MPGREGDRGPRGGFAQEGRNGCRGRSGRQRRGHRGRRERDPAADEGAAKFLLGAVQPAVHGPDRPAEPPGGLGQREALEVAEHHRQPRRGGQPVDLLVEGLGLLALEQGPIGGDGAGRARLGAIHDAVLLVPADAGEPAAGLAGRADRHAVEPVAQQPVGIAHAARRRARTRKTAWKASSA